MLLDDKDGEVIYCFRSVPLIRDFIDVQIDDCDAELREVILRLLRKIQAAGEGYANLPRSQKGETKVLRRAMSDVLSVLQFA